MASAARQGTAISSATFAHISGLNLKSYQYISLKANGLDHPLTSRKV
jgi:hypothetical protein